MIHFFIRLPFFIDLLSQFRGIALNFWVSVRYALGTNKVKVSYEFEDCSLVRLKSRFARPMMELGLNLLPLIPHSDTTVKNGVVGSKYYISNAQSFYFWVSLKVEKLL